MSVWSNIARAFGFGGDAPEAEEESWQEDDAAEAPPQPAEHAGPVEVDPAQVHAIFQRVIEVFNNTLPEFLSRSVDPEKQRKYLYDSLDNSMKNYLAELQLRATEYCTAQWQAERDRLKEESEQLRKRADELEAKKSALADKQLSTDRQKRALSERVRDLENQIVKLEAEKEQLDIENKCMVNKAKAASVLEEEIEGLRQENLRLNEARSQEDSGVITQEQYDEIQAQISRFEDVKAKLDGRIDKLRHTLKESQAENQSLRDTIKENLISAAKTQQEMNDRIASLTQQLEEAQAAAKPAEEKPVPAKKTERKRPDSKHSSAAGNPQGGVDQLINGADWMVSAPPEESPMHVGTEDTFGYTAPPRKTHPVPGNDTQLSLFDF